MSEIAEDQRPAEMGLAVVGAAGRMGQTLIRTICAMDGVRLVGAIERAGSPYVGRDAGELAGVGPLGVAITDDPLPVFVKAEGLLDFTAPAATVEFAALAAQARIVHVIGTTGCSPDDDAKIRAAARHLLKAKEKGRVINMTSVVGEMGNAGQAAYAASKAAIIGLTKTLAREFASRGLCVNAVAPGFIETDMTAEHLPEAQRAQLLAGIPLGRIGAPHDVADAVAFLAGPEAGYITGQVLRVNGGLLM